MSKASGSPAVGVDPPLEAEPHLRAVLERQPVVLTRVSKDGTFLAINEAGLSMLGAQSLEQVLGTSIMNMVEADDRKACQAFLDRAASGQRGSFEVDLIGLTGSRHTLELHGNAHPGAPDGLSSVLISFRDVTESRRLEQSLVDAAARQAEQETAWENERKRLLADLDLARKAQTDQFAVDEQLTELERRLAEAQDGRRAAEQAHADEVARLKEAIAEERRKLDLQLAASARLDGTDQQLAELRGRYDALESERQQLLETAGLLRSEAEARQHTLNELTERLEALEGERQYAVDTSNALRLDLDERNAIVADLTSRLQQLEAEAQQGAAASSQLERELESRTALAGELAGRIEQLESELAVLRETAEAELAALRQTAASEIDALRAAHEAERASLRAAGESALDELQGRYDTDTGALRDALNDAMGEQARLAETTAAAEREAAEKTDQLAALQQSLEHARSEHQARVTEIQATAASRIGELEVRLADAERAATARVADLEAAEAARTAEMQTVEAAFAARAAELEAAHAAQVAALEAAHAARVTELEAALTQASERADEALAAVQRAEEAFSGERQRLEDALLAAVDAEKAAKHALSTEIASRTVAERSHRQMQAAIERFAKEAGVSIAVGSAGPPPPPPKPSTTMRAVASRLGSELQRRLGDGLELRMLASSVDGVIEAEEASVVNAVGAFADSRRVSMLSGQVTVEVAEVAVDEGVGRMRGMSPGKYALVAMNVEGPGAQQGIPQETFESADPRAWREVKDELQSARSAIVAAGGQVWLSREGASIMIVEFYLPREGAR